jgi:hypothetical protein
VIAASGREHDDPLRVDPDQYRWSHDRLSSPADLDPAVTPRIRACEIVDHDRSSAGPRDVAELLRPPELPAAQVPKLGLTERVPPHPPPP